MKVTVADKEKSQKELSVEIPAQVYKDTFEKEFDKAAKTVKVAGFRQGKAPKDVVLKEKGHAIRVYALEHVINEAVKNAIEENGIRAMGQPEVKDVKFEDDDSPITFKVYVDVFPTYDIEKFSGFEFTKEINSVEAADVDNVLDNLLKRQAAFEPAEGPVENGCVAVIDFEGKLNGEIIPQACAKEYPLEIGSGNFIPGFEEQVIGMNKGEVKDITVTFPETYHEKSLAGQPVVFTITLHEVKKKAAPALDDAFAKSINEKYETVDALKKAIEADLKSEAEDLSKDALYNAILDKLIEENPFDIPAVMVVEQAEKLAEQTLRQYSMYGMNPEQFGLNKKKLAEQHMANAERQIKSALVINKISEKNNINPTDEDVEKAIAEYAEKFERSVDEFKKELEQYGGINSFRNTVFTNMVYDYLTANNKIAEKVISKAERDAKIAEASQAAKEA
ncbi:trigger factor [Seleniivibrio woodruffii]|uniref:trigger factor n=1 Tax=Seleniivibrio woodruffii TaxID=1078050 RepID=UPI0039E22262